jgi:transposase
MSTTYFGVDFHSRQQTICYLTTNTGDIHAATLSHESKEEVRAFYSQFRGPVIVGVEASGYSRWFERMLDELGHEIWLGDASEIRRRAKWRHKTDRKDAELILDLMIHDEFPRVHRPSAVSCEILRTLRYRHKLVKMRTIIKNCLQALAIQSGLCLQARLFTSAGMEQLLAADMSPVMQQQRDQWLALLEPLNERITQAMFWLKQQAQGDLRITRLRTHPGIGLLTALGLVHTLEPVGRFPNQRRVAAYGGFDPIERSSAGKKRFLGISKAGSRLLRFLLVEAAQTAVKGDPELKRFYRRLESRRGRPTAKVAVARKLLVRAFIMMRDEIEYAEFKRRAVVARFTRENARSEGSPSVPVSLIG